MRKNIQNKSKALEKFGLDPDVAIDIGKFRKTYHKFLSNTETVKLKSILFFERVDSVKKGDLVIDNYYFKNLRVWIVSEEEESTKRKTFNKVIIKDKRISAEYLLWCLSQKSILDYLSLFAKGTVISSIPISAIKEIEIPIPKRKITSTVKKIEIPSGGQYKEAIRNNLLNEYKKCRENKLILSALVIAGSIAEALLSEYLIEEGVKKKLLERKTLGGLIDFFEVRENANKKVVQQFRELAKARNHIHINELIKKGNVDEKWAESAFVSFNNIIKEFGI